MLVTHTSTFYQKVEGKVVAHPPGTPVELEDRIALEKIADGRAEPYDVKAAKKAGQAETPAGKRKPLKKKRAERTDQVGEAILELEEDNAAHYVEGLPQVAAVLELLGEGYEDVDQIEVEDVFGSLKA